MKFLKLAVLLILISCTATSTAEEETIMTIENEEVQTTGTQKAYFAGGCFWCMEPPFEAMEGVLGATGETGHAEVVEILFDPDVVSYEELLEVFWRNIDPTALNYQFADVGSQYRTEIFTVGEAQMQKAEASKKALGDSGKFDKPIVTAISLAPTFYIAEEYHQDFYKKQAMRYEMYAKASGRKGYIEETWGND